MSFLRIALIIAACQLAVKASVWPKKWISMFSGLSTGNSKLLKDEPDDSFFDDEDDPDCDMQHINLARDGFYFEWKDDEETERDILSLCEFVQNHCDPEGNFNFFELYYCSMQHMSNTARNLIFVPFGLFCMFLFFYILGDTADSYLSPSLERITIKTGISQSLAGVTLLSFGNGAPDIFSAISSAGSSTRNTESQFISDNKIASSALLGSAFFIISVVFTLVTAAAKPDRKV